MKPSPTVLWPSRSPWKRSALVSRLRAALKGRVEEAYLFGSHARGDATADSDVDLILVTATKAPWPERGRAFLDLCEAFGALDLLVYTPDEWQAMWRSPTGFLEKAKAEWVRLL